MLFFMDTHIVRLFIIMKKLLEKEGVTVFNPGSIALPRQMTPAGPTFLIIDLADDGRLTPELYTL